MHDWVAGLLRFRNSHSVFADGGQQNLLHDATSLVYVRARDLQSGCGQRAERVLVAVNNADEAANLLVDPTDTALAGCTRFVAAIGTNIPAELKAGKVYIALGAKQVAIYEVQ